MEENSLKRVHFINRLSPLVLRLKTVVKSKCILAE
jgi:hypothetical protein